MGIRRRLVLSFLALFVVVFVATAAVSTVMVTRAVKRRLGAQARNLADLIERQPRIADNREFLLRFSQLYDAEVSVRPAGEASAGDAVYPVRLMGQTLDGRELVVTYGPEVISREKAAAVEPFILVAAGGLLLVLVLGTLTARAIARPLENLAKQARLPAKDVKPVGGGAELDHLVEAMNRMLEEVRRAERLAVMGQMAAGVAHEIRNPLSSIKMTVQMLRDEWSDPEPFDRLLREIERLELTAAELVGASQPLRKERVKLDTIVDDVLELMHLRLDHLSVRVDRKKHESAPEVEVDVARFKRCVMNLVLNGAQSMPEGGPLGIEVAPRDGRVRFSVTDAGGGVPEAVRDRIFEPFVTTKQDGVGLGLALTRRIVEDHGGAIGFEPVPRGSTFWIELPRG
jgi:signal transduction histidine kinase